MPLYNKMNLYSYDANPDGSVKISSLMKHFQQIAREDLDNSGLTYPKMRQANQAFVIIKAKIEFNQKMSIYDELFLKTVPTKIVGVSFFRDFFVTDFKGNIVALATTSWVLVNFESRRILKPTDILYTIPEFPNENAGLKLSRKFCANNPLISKSTNVRKVCFNNLDENNHLNNAEISGFVVDEIAERLISGNQIDTFEIHFNQESKLNDELTLNTVNYDKSSIVSAFNNRYDSSAFECEIIYK